MLPHVRLHVCTSAASADASDVVPPPWRIHETARGLSQAALASGDDYPGSPSRELLPLRTVSAADTLSGVFATGGRGAGGGRGPAPGGIVCDLCDEE